MPNYKILPMESHHALPGIEYEKSSSYLMLSPPAWGEGSENDWSLVRKCSQLLSIAIRRGKGGNQEHLTKGRQRDTETCPWAWNFTLSKKCSPDLFLGLLLHHPVVHFVQSAQGWAHCSKPPIPPYPSQVRGANQRFACRLPASLTSLPLYYCWHFIYIFYSFFPVQTYFYRYLYIHLAQNRVHMHIFW